MRSKPQLDEKPTITNFDTATFQQYEHVARAIYKTAFAQDPWFESISAENMDEVFARALHPDSVFMGAFNGSGECSAMLIGFPLAKSKVNDLVSEEDANAAIYLSDICTDTHQQGLGIGRQLLSQFEQQCAAAGISRVILRTHANCEWLCNFYQSAGYEKLLDFNFPIIRQLEGVATSVDCIRTIFRKSLPHDTHPGAI